MLNIEGAEIKAGAANTVTIGTETGARAALWFRGAAEAKINQGVYDIKVSRACAVCSVARF